MPTKATKRPKQPQRANFNAKYPKGPVTEDTIKEITKALYTTRDWFTKYGRRYHIPTLERLKERCKQTITPTSAIRQRLPSGWDARQHGHRFYIFHTSKDPIYLLSQKSAKLQPHIPEEIIQAIRIIASNGLKLGDQRDIARRYSISESMVSRVIRKLRRFNPTDNTHPQVQSTASPLNPATVDAVLKRLFTAKDWLNLIGNPVYRINDIGYVNQMCAGKRNGPSKTCFASLPAGWHSVRTGRSWLIYHRTLATRATLIRRAENNELQPQP